MAIGDNSSIEITIDVVDGNGTVQTIDATTASIQQLGVAGTATGANLGAVGAGASTATAASQALGSVGSNAMHTVAQGAAAAVVPIVQVGTNVGVVASGLQQMGAAGTTGAAAVASGMQQVSGHTLTSLDNVRLLRDDLGIRIPRSMEVAISRSAVLSTAIGAIGSGLLALGAFEIFARMGAAIYDAYNKYISLDAAAEAYQETVEKQRDEDFTNTHSIETTTARIKEANEAAKTFKDLGVEIQHGAWADIFGGNASQFASGVASLLQGRKDADAGYKDQGQSDALSQKRISDAHEIALLQIQEQHASDKALGIDAKRTAEAQRQLAIHKEDQNYDREQDSARQGGGFRSAGSEKRRLEDSITQKDEAADAVVQQRQVTDQIITMQNEARNAALQGEALYYAQEQESIAAVQRKEQEGALTRQQAEQEIAAVSQKYDAEKQKRLEDQTAEVLKRERAEQEASLTGIARSEAEGKDKQSDINQRQSKGLYADQTGAGSPSALADRDRVTANAETTREIADQEKALDQEVASLADRAADQQIGTYGKIQAAQNAAATKFQDDWSKVYGQLTADDGNFAKGQEVNAEGNLAIFDQADRERVALHQKTMEQINQVEIQAARVNETENKAAMDAIAEEYNQRVTKAQAALHQELAANKDNADAQALIWQEYYATIKADADLAAAQMERTAQQTRDRLASGLKDLFTDPAGYIEKQAEETMYKVLANGLMEATNNLQSDAGKWIAQLFGLGPDLAAPVPGQNGQSTIPGGGIIKNLFGQGQTGSEGSALTTAGSTLSTAGTTLNTSGTTLTTAGTTLTSSGTALSAAAAALQSATASLSALGAGGSGAGGLGSIASSLGLGDGSGGDLGDGTGAGDLGDGASSGTLYNDAAGGVAPTVGTDTAGGTFDTSAVASGSSELSGSAATGGASSLGEGIGIAGAAVAGGIGLYNAYENSSPGTGAIEGGLAGASIGTMILPGIGTVVGGLIGGAVGAIAGFFGELFGDNGRGKAKDYDKNTVAPALQEALENFQSGQEGYNDVSKSLQSILSQAQTETQSMGSGARHYFSETIAPEIAQIQAMVDSEEKGGRSKLAMSAAQFHTGGVITNFGDFSTSGTEGFIHALMGERVMTPQVASTHGAFLDAMEFGTFLPMMRGAAASIAGGGTTRLGTSSSGSSLTIPITAIDAPSFQRALRYGGLGQEIMKYTNGAPSNYGGKSLG